MAKSKLLWLGILLVSSPLLVWRLIDFVEEAKMGWFHMTRFGQVLSLWGDKAEIAQIIIILTMVILVWKAATHLHGLTSKT